MYNSEHVSVLLTESIDALNIKKNGKYIDATLGAAGHSCEILARGGTVLGIDQDTSMLEVARKNLEVACPPAKNEFSRFILVHDNFSNIDLIASDNDFNPADGVLMDLGVSSLHFDSIERGFSFRKPEELLDMRLNLDLGVTAADLLNSLDKRSLTDLFALACSQNQAWKLSQKVIKAREHKRFVTVGDFLDLFGRKVSKIHPATKPMMALRMAVNSELAVLEEALPKAFDILSKGGRLVVISFHSGEDKITKEFFKKKEFSGEGTIITKMPVVPNESELAENVRSRSAKMRVIEKL